MWTLNDTTARERKRKRVEGGYVCTGDPVGGFDVTRIVRR